jgi:hypothetical protein
MTYTNPGDQQPQYPQYPQYPQQPGQPYGYGNTPPGYGPPAATSNGLAIAGLVCGIVGLLVANIILGPLAIIFGGIGLSRANRGAPYRGLAIAALVLGAVDIIIFIALIAWLSNHGMFL